MPSTESVIKTYFDAFNRHDLDEMLMTLTDDVAHDINEGGREVGKEAFRKFKAHMDKCYREQIRDLVIMTKDSRGTAEFIVDGEYIATDEGLPEATGQKYSIPAAAIFEVSESGKITRVTSYYNLKGWIAAIS
jgi:steroid delta-isomerase-like uncharacterized protein